MKKIALVLISIFFCSAVSAEQSPFKLVNYKELKVMLENSAKVPVHIYDANGEKTRGEKGVIPGATLLTSPSEYDVTKVLPPDHSATLVFYCYNPKCTASHTAAERAVGAGYKNAAVFSDGIVGWIENGEKVNKAG